jgi:hypothetical protein
VAVAVAAADADGQRTGRSARRAQAVAQRADYQGAGVECA